MNLPNKLTVLRLCMVPIFLVFLCLPLPLSDTTVRIVTAAIFILTSITDMLDGKIARARGLITDFGKFMDPLADKFMVISAMLGILYRYDYLRTVFVWAAAIVIFRELAVTSIRMITAQKCGKVVSASWLGKIKTVTQIVCISTILLEPVVFCWFPPFGELHILSYVTLAAMTVMTVWSGMDYLRTYWKYLDPQK